MKIIRRFSRISLINLSKKSYVNFRGTGILGNPLLTYRKNHKPVLKAKGLHSSKIFREIPY